MRTDTLVVIAIFLLIIMIGSIGFYSGRTVGYDKPNPDDFMIADVMIEDSVYGQDPILHPRREIIRSFRVRWTVEVNTSEGQYICSATDQTVYTPDSQTPDTVRLFDWWMLARGAPEDLCLSGMYPLPVGCYYVDTVWEAVDFEGRDATIFNRSNEFCVRPRIKGE